MDSKNIILKPGKVVSVIGGTGFLGSYVVKELAKTGCQIKVISRRALQDGKELRVTGAVGQVSQINCNITDENSLAKALHGSDVVINLVGILHSRGKQNFQAIHCNGAENVAKLCKLLGVKRLIHISALGVDRASQTSQYAKSKFAGEKAVMAQFNNAIIVRPGVMFGPNDSFISPMAKIMKFLPIFPLIGGGKALMQPVYVNDVAEAILEIIAMPKEGVNGKVFEIAGPFQYTFKRIIQLILKAIDKRAILLPIPYPIAKILSFFLEMLPNPPITREQAELMKYDNIVIGNNSLTVFNIDPTPLEPILKSIFKLGKYRLNML